MDLPKLARWLLVALVVLVAWKEGLPRLRARLAASDRTTAGAGVADDDAERCVRDAAAVAREFGEGFPPFAENRGDTAGWMRFAGQLQVRLRDAQARCGCAGEACDRAAEALGRLDSLIQRTDGLVRGSPEALFNPATDMETIDELLDRARDALREPS